MIREVLPSHRPVAQLAVCVGVAGAGRSDEQRALTDRLRQEAMDEAGAVAVEVVHDACIALETAFGEESGVVVIAGTGSLVFGRAREGGTHRAGGWGNRLGDAGSGYAVGRAGLRAVAAAFDGGPATVLRARMQEQHGIEDRDGLLRWVYQDEGELQRLAPLVVDTAAAGDTVATEILVSQAAELAKQAAWLLGGTGDIAPRIAMLGGMLRNEYYAQVLRRALGERLPGASVEAVRRAPVVGALRRARRVWE